MNGKRRFAHVPARVVVVGGGVAGLETCLALEALAGERVETTLIAPGSYFEHRPVGACDPLAVHARERVPVAHVARAAGADLRHDRVVAVDPGTRRVWTAAGYELPYDALVLAVGAVPDPVPARAEAFDERQPTACRAALRGLLDGTYRSLAFVEPAAPARAFDLYDLAVDAAVKLRLGGRRADLTLVTAAPAPLALLGPSATFALRSTLAAHGLRVVESAHVRSIDAAGLELAPLSRRVTAERVIAAPRLSGPRIAHLPCDRDGFLPVDRHGRVTGADRVFAAGDCTAFPVKHPSLAAQQADAVAATIAAGCGLGVAEPFAPVLRGILPTRLRWYVEAPLTGGKGDDATRISATALWSPRVRFAARHLAPLLGREGGDEPAGSEPAARELARAGR